MEDTAIKNVIAAVGIVISLSGFVLAYFVHRLEIQKKEELALQTYRELHELFWSNEVFKQVRSWLACDVAFDSVKEIFEKRKNIHDNKLDSRELSLEEYGVIESMDRCLNFLKRIHAVSPNIKYKKEIWESLFFKYWFNKMLERDIFHWYIKVFYIKLYETYVK